MRLGLAGIFAMAVAANVGAQDSPPSPAGPPPPPVIKGKTRGPIPAGDPGRWVTLKDYPPEAKEDHISGVVGFRVIIDPAGRVADCQITSSSGFKSLDDGTCVVLRRNARFRPALDEKGNPTTGSWSSRVRWVAPDNGPPPKLDELTTVQTFVVEPDGTASNCSATRNGVAVTDAIAQTPCATGEKFEPFHGLSGKPVRKKVMVTRTVKIADPD